MNRPARCLLFTAVALLGAALSAVQPFDLSKKLEIELSSRDEVSIDEIAYFSQAADRVFKDRKFGGSYAVDYYSGASQSDLGPLLDIQLIRWGAWTPMEIECRIYVVAISEGKRHDLGVFRGLASRFAPITSQREERIIESAAGALDDLYDRLIEAGLIEKAE